MMISHLKPPVFIIHIGSNEHFNKFGVLLFMAVGLFGCSGGGGGSSGGGSGGPVTSTLYFPVQSAYKSMVANGFSKTFTFTVTSTFTPSQNCSGTGALTVTAANIPVTYNSITGFSASDTISYVGCAYWASFIPSVTVTRYYDSNYNPTGSSSIGTYPTPPTFPSSALVGMTGSIGTETNSLTGSSTKTNVLTYLIEADTAISAIVNIMGSYTEGYFVQSTEQDRYRIKQTGALTPVSRTTQFSSSYSVAAPLVTITFN